MIEGFITLKLLSALRRPFTWRDSKTVMANVRRARGGNP